MDIEQSVPTVAELRGKSDQAGFAAPSRRRKAILYTSLVAPFLLLAVILIVVFSIADSNKKNDSKDLRNMDHSESFTSVVDYLREHEISDHNLLVQEGTYQNQAVQFMAHLDPHSMKIPKESPASKEGYVFMQRYVMALMYHQMNGKQWKYNLNFLVAENTCDWFSWIVKAKSATPMGVRCSDNGLVEAIVMISTNVVGSFPTEIGRLSTLRVLEMDVNEISGSLPSEFHKLEALANLHLSHNKLSGPLPSYLCNFNDLVSIDVSFNQMTGALPSEVALTMPNLRGIAVDNNLFTGTVPFWERTRPTAGIRQEKLEYLFLEKNNFEGVLREGFGTLVPNLKVFDGSDNQFRGPLPPALFRLQSLQVLDLHDNIFTGPIPQALPGNTALRFLSLHKNKLSGSMPESLGNLQLLLHLDLSNNYLTGIGRNQVTGLGISSLPGLTYLFMSANDFPAGPVPEWIGSMTTLEELSLKSLKLTSTIPPFLEGLTNLILLDLDDNELRGPIPSELGNLSKLQFLLLNRNDLTDQVPQELGNIDSLRLLYLDHNALVGDLGMICNRPGAPPSIIASDCKGSSPEVECECCQLCCQDGETCNQDILVPSNDPLWQFSYNRVFYSFGNFTGHFFA